MRWDLRLFYLMIISLIYMPIEAELYFEQKQVKNDIEICAYDDAKNIGFVSYVKIPLMSFYIIHSLYIYPEHRQQGYGRKLMRYVCGELARVGATCIYIQSGPFERVNGYGVRIEDYQERMDYLISFYESMGFKKVDAVTSWLASLLYTIANIEEDAQYLMMKKVA